MDLPPSQTRHGSPGGFSLVELIIALSVLAVSASIFYRLVLTTTALRGQNRENGMAADAARVLLEEMRAEDFKDLFALYNSDPSDDPGGAGTAPGDRFLVPGLRLPTGEAFHGTVTLPAALVEVQEEVAGELVSLQELRLLENLDLPALGLPRDLNGDSLIDALDHSLDYQLLPIQVIVRWESLHGTRSFDLTTMVCEYR